jgi:hypothetical protein
MTVRLTVRSDVLVGVPLDEDTQTDARHGITPQFSPAADDGRAAATDPLFGVSPWGTGAMWGRP